MQTTSKIKIGIADDHALFRKGLIKLLDVERYELLFDVSNGKDVIEMISKTEAKVPDIIIIDLEMPGMNGYELVSWLREHQPDVRVLIVSMVDREEAILRMLKLGVKGYLPKDIEPEDLHAALQSINDKNYYYTDFITNKLVHAIQNEDRQPDNGKGTPLHNYEFWDSLNDRQKEFIRYACTEMKYDEIADKMCVSPKTIDGYRDIVFERLGVKSRIGLVLYAIKNSLVTV